MVETASSVLTPWLNFYIITGSSAAALTGLMFVVISMVTGRERLRRRPDGIGAFSTPTVVHFSSALLASEILSAPWRLLAHPAALLGLGALCGIVYILRVTYRARRLSDYEPDAEDWTWYTILPFIAYGAILGGSIFFPAAARNAMFVLAGGITLLIFIGIHNAWDIVTYIAIGGGEEPPS